MWGRVLVALTLLVPVSVATRAGESIAYSPAKVIYDISSPDPQALKNVLDRASTLQNLYGNNPFEASIVIVVHEGAIPLFAKTKSTVQKESMLRAASLALGEIIDFRVCAMSARMQGLGAGDFDDFISLIPMADAEIVQLQRDGYAYLR